MQFQFQRIQNTYYKCMYDDERNTHIDRKCHIGVQDMFVKVILVLGQMLFNPHQ